MLLHKLRLVGNIIYVLHIHIVSTALAPFAKTNRFHSYTTICSKYILIHFIFSLFLLQNVDVII